MYVVTYSNPHRGNFVLGRVSTRKEAEQLSRANGGRKDRRNAPDCYSVRGEPEAGIWITVADA